MKRVDYLKWCIHNKAASQVAWVLSILSVMQPAVPKTTFPGTLRVEPWGLSFLNDAGEFEKIEDSVANQPLFTIKDVIQVDNTWLSSIQAPIETTVGRLIWNYCTVFYAFGAKFPYLNERKSIGDVEAMIIAKRKELENPNDPRDPNGYYVDEYVKFHDGILHLEHLASVTAVSLTKKAVIAPTGIKEFKAGLVKKYGDKLTDPVELAKFKQELAAFDDEFRKGDASKHFIQGKIRNNSRMRVHLTLGTDLGFDNKTDVVPIPNSLKEGWPKDPKQFVTLMNGTRKGSYDRGAETVNGGVAAKVMLRAGNNFKIVDTDCGVSYGIPKTYNAKNIDKLVGRYIIQQGKPFLVENKTVAANLVDKLVIVRSPAVCKLDGECICAICAGKKLQEYPTGLTIPLTEISNILLYIAMKSMHNSELKIGKFNIADVLS